MVILEKEVAQVDIGKILNWFEEKKLIEQIRKIEEETTGEVHIHLEFKTSKKDTLNDAVATFHNLKMDHTPHRNAVLIYISVKDHELACCGDKGIHEKVGDEGWKNLVHELRTHFKQGDYYFGLSKTLDEVGGYLRRYFPANDKNDENKTLA